MDSKVTMLAVGQGAMNLIEIYDNIDGKKVLVNLSLIDCGSIDGHPASKAACEASLEYAVGKMRERYEFGDCLLLDNLLITHRDGDHWNLLDRLFRMTIGMETALISENIGYLRVEESDDHIENYYVNRIDSIFRYEKNYYGECEIELTFSFRVNGQDVIPDMILEYEYGDDYMSVCWSPGFLHVYVSNDKLADLCLSGKYDLYTLNGMSTWKIPSTYAGFLQVFFGRFGIFQRIKETVINMPAEHEKVMVELLKKIEISKEDIEKAVMQNPDHVPPFIQNVYIGGNSSASGGKFSAMEKTLKMLSPNDVFEIEKGSFIDLYGGFRLYIIENLAVDELIQLTGAESVKKASIKNNATSIVSVLLLDGVPEFEKIVFTGDATVHTFYQMLLDIDEVVEYQNAIWTAPHHGAYTTIHGQIPDNEEEREVFPVLLEQAQPKKIVISAGVENIHGHPCFWFVCDAAEVLQSMATQGMPHDIYYNTNNSNKKCGAEWKFISTQIPLYTTYTILQNGSEGYRDYVFSFPPENAVPAENLLLLENREEPAGRVFGSTAIPVKTEIPSKSMFFHR